MTLVVRSLYSCPTDAASFQSPQWYGVVDGQAPLNLTRAANQAATTTLLLPARSLPAGATVVLAFKACYAATIDSDARACSTAAASFTVAASPLVAALSGANVVAGFNPVTLDCGSGSSDPDGEPGSLEFEWRCQGPNPAGCFNSDGAPLRMAKNVSTQARFFLLFYSTMILICRGMTG